MLRASHKLILIAVAATVAGCASKRGSPDDEPTLKTLAGRKVDVAPDDGIKYDEAQTIAAYKKFLEVAPKAPQRAEAMRRIGDLEMDIADKRLAEGLPGATLPSGAPDYRAAIARYEDYLKTYPKDPGNDRVLYQLARAQEQGGELEVSLKTLDRLVAEYPNTAYANEAQFRRGELLFAMKDYPKAEKAYTTLLAAGDTPWRERSLYMQGWSMFKQGRLEEALKPFFEVLDIKIANRGDEAELADVSGLTRADRELVEDTFRVTSISLANLQGYESIPPYIVNDTRKSYEFRVYQQLGELYIKQERVKDAADTFGAFVKRNPLHAQAPVLQARVIDIYQGNGFATLALDAKRDYVSRYGVDGEFNKRNPGGWEKAKPLVKAHLTDLARHFHATAQKTKATADYQEAVRWYRAYIASFPKEPDTAQNNFLLGELLYEDGRFAEAATEYERTAYDYPAHAKSADAGYAALLAYAQQEKKASAAELPPLQKASVDSALRFADANPKDARTPTVLTNASEKLFTLKDGDRAVAVAQQVLKLDPPAPAAQRKVAWTVISHDAFEKGRFDAAEKGYGEVLALTPEKEAGRNDLVERLAASVYKQGEKARAEGKATEAIGHFNRVAVVAPASTVRATAQYDAAAAMLGQKDWDGAARALEDFRQRYPNHPLTGDVSTKLTVAYLEKGNWTQAAAELEKVAATSKDPKVVRDAMWQTAELHEKAGSRPQARLAYEKFLKQYPQPLDSAVEARYRLAKIAKADGDAKREFALMQEIFRADQTGGAQRTDRTRRLGGTAALAMAEPALAEYRKVQLVEPLAKQLKLKKAKMEDVLKAYAVAAEYGVADVTTAATYQTASLYQDFGKSMLTSQRPKKLSKAELEQYNVLLEEQAFPFEEKAIELHEANARRAADGVYDPWVKKSYEALATLRPVRYGKLERSEGVIDAIR